MTGISGSTFGASAQLSVSRSSGQRTGAASAGSSGQSQAVSAESNTNTTDNFKAALEERFERAQKTGRMANKSPEETQELIDAVGRAVVEVKKAYGKEAANGMMAGILKGLDKNGCDLEGLTGSISLGLRDAAQASHGASVKDLAESFNKGLGVKDEEGQTTRKGLSQTINDYFELDIKKENGAFLAKGFTASGQWGKVAVSDPEAGPGFVNGTPEMAEAALRNTATFSLDSIDEEVVNNMVSFLRDKLGAESAAEYLEGASDGADFMNVMNTVIGLTMRDADDPSAVARLEAYLNSDVKSAVNDYAGSAKNSFGYVEFKGWDMSAGGGSDSKGAFTANWGYTNRDDAKYEIKGEALPKRGENKSSKSEETESSPLVEQMNRLAKQASAKNGDLVDTVA